MAQSRTVAKNTFGEGLIMDFAPDNTQANVLTNALNATMLTYNGNEMSLQNDMGNGRVETAFLPEGYIPMGVCEFGGIIYIVSYNPLDDLCQIGSFPSPERNITKEDRLAEDMKPSPILNSYFLETNSGTPTGKIKALVSKVIIRENSLNPGDKYIIQSNRDYYTDSDIKSLSGLAGDGQAKKLKLSIVSVEDSGKITKLETLNYNVNTIEGTKEFNILNDNSISTAMGTDIDAYRLNLQQNYNVFSARVPGKLAILAELEVIANFSCAHRIVTKTYKVSSSEYTTYDVYLDYKWESEDPTINPKYITLTDFTWESNLKNLSFAKYYNESGAEITLNLDCTYLTNDFNPSSLVAGNTMHVKLPKLIDGDTSYFYHTITSRGSESFDNYIYRNSTFTNDHRREMNFLVQEGNSTSNKKLTVGNQLGEIEVNNKLGLSNTTYLFSITIPSRFDNYIFRLPFKLHYEVTPAMLFGLLEHLAIDNEIDFSLIGTKVIQPTGIKYFASLDLVTINIDNEIYEEENHKVTNMILEFYDVNGFCGSYFFEDRESYAGNLVTNIPFNSLYLRKYKYVDYAAVKGVKSNNLQYLEDNIPCWYHNLYGNLNTNAYQVSKGADTGDCGILYSNMLYGVKLLYVYSSLNPISLDVENVELVEKGFWLYTNGQFNDYYYSVDNYSAIKFQLPLIYSYKMVDKTYKENIKLEETTGKHLNELLNAESGDIDKFNEGKTSQYALTTLVDYTGGIDFEINIGLSEGSIYSLILLESDNVGASISLRLISPYEDGKTFTILELEKESEKESEKSEENEEVGENPSIYTKFDANSQVYLEKNSVELNKSFSASTKIHVEIPKLQFITIPTEYKKQMVNTTILTPILYKYEEEDASFNYEDIGGETMFLRALCYVGSDDTKSDSSDYESDDRWFETSISDNEKTYDSLLYEYPAGKRHTNLVDGHENLVQHYNALGNRLPFTLFTIQMPEPNATSKYGYFPKWSYNIMGAGSVYSKNNDASVYETPPTAKNCYIIQQAKDHASDYMPYYENRQYLPAFINNRIAEGGYSVLMSSSGGNTSNFEHDLKKLPYTAHSSDLIRSLFYKLYVLTMKELITVNPEYKNCEVGTFEYDLNNCKNLQMVSVVSAKFNPTTEFINKAKDMTAIHGIQFSRYISLLLNKMQSVLTDKDNNVALEFDLSLLGKDQETAITYINYTMLHEHDLIDKFLDFGNAKIALFLNGYYCKGSKDYISKWSTYLYKIDEYIQESKFYMAYADKKDGLIKFKLVRSGSHDTDNQGHIRYLYDSTYTPSVSTTNVKYTMNGNSIFYNTTMRIEDFVWEPYNNKHHFYFNKDSSLTIVDSKFSYLLDDDAAKGKDYLIVRPYYIGPSFKHTFS